MDCLAKWSSGHYGPDSLVCHSIVSSPEVNALVMWCRLDKDYFFFFFFNPFLCASGYRTLRSMSSCVYPSTTAFLLPNFPSINATPSAVVADVVQCQALSL